MKLQVVKTDKGYVAVSDFKNINKVDRYYNLKSKMFLDHDYEDLTSLTENDVKIIATDTSFKLEGIPQFELESVSAGSIAIDAWNKISTPEDADIAPYYIDGYMNGYEAAQSKGCFTEEDVKRALVLKNMGYGEKYILDSLKQPKKLVAIEVDTRLALAGYNEKGNAYMKEVFKMIESEQYPDGLLTIKEYFYD